MRQMNFALQEFLQINVIDTLNFIKNGNYEKMLLLS